MKTFIRPLDKIDLKGKRVFLRVDFNVPIKNGKIQDTRRIDEALPTIKYVLEKEGKLLVGSHFGRPDGVYSEELSMTPIAEYLGDVLGYDILLVDEPDSDAPKALFNGLKPKQIIMLENLRFLKGETENSDALANKWASFTDVYINDAFGVSHRAHCSVSALPRVVPLRTYGLLVEKELKNLSLLVQNPPAPFGLVLGGAKVSDKMTILERLLPKTDVFIIGGAMANTFLKAKDIPVGASKVEDDKVGYAKEFLLTCERKNKKVFLPLDFVVSSDFEGTSIDTVQKIPPSKMALDIGPKTAKLFSEEISKLKTVFWNGPMGVFENTQFENGTKTLCEAISSNQGFTVVGGGDSASAAQKFGGDFTHISTGGGASLEYLEGKDLPGVSVLNLSRNEIAALQRIEWVSEAYEDIKEEIEKPTDHKKRY